MSSLKITTAISPTLNKALAASKIPSITFTETAPIAINAYILSLDSISRLFHRSYPPLSSSDTLIIDPITREPKSCHGKTRVFQNNEIKTVHRVTHKEFFANRREFSYKPTSSTTPVYIEYTKYVKPIIQQQATRGCTAAAVAMLLKERKKEICFSLLRTTNLGNTERMTRWITNASLTPIVTDVKELNSLTALLNKHGSAIISISGNFGSHVVVLDHLNKEYARLRDPYHGWEITVYRSALERYFMRNEVIQIK